MFNRIRRRVRRLIEPNVAAAAPRDTTVQLRLPSPYGGTPWLTATVAISATPRGQGEALRLRAHFDGALRMPPAGAERKRLALDSGASRGLIRHGRNAAAPPQLPKSLIRSVISDSRICLGLEVYAR